jgi:hypothetical protein
MAHQLTGKTIASTYEQLIYRTTTVPSTGTTTTQLMTSEADQTDDIGLPLYISTERVGIGIAAPTILTHIYANDASAAQLRIEQDSTGDAALSFRLTDEVSSIIGVDNTDNALKFSVDSNALETNTAMTILTSGNVGIGTTSPVAIDTYGNSGTLTVADHEAGTLVLQDEDAGDDEKNFFLSSQGQNFTIGKSDDDGANPVVRLKIWTGGKVSIPGVSGSQVLIDDSALADDAATSFRTNATASGESTDHLTQIGLFVHSGITDPTSFVALTTQDSVIHYLWANDDDDFHASTTAGHIGTASGTKMADMTSDERLKNISSDAFPYGLDAVNNLTPIQYTWKEKSDKSNRLGFGAQTTQSIIPETVRDTGQSLDGYTHVDKEDGSFESVPKGIVEGNTKLIMEYNQIVPVLVKAIQELSAKVTALENA